MALVSGGRSTLNPNAPLFIPAAVRQVEDFSPEWWELVTTASWFRDYWLSQQQGEDGFYGNGEDEFSGNDVVDLLPDTIDLSIDDEFSIMEAQFEEFILSSEAAEASKSSLSSMKGVPQNGLVMDAEAMMKNLSLSKSLKEKKSQVPRTSKVLGEAGKVCEPKIKHPSHPAAPLNVKINGNFTGLECVVTLVYSEPAYQSSCHIVVACNFCIEQGFNSCILPCSF